MARMAPWPPAFSAQAMRVPSIESQLGVERAFASSCVCLVSVSTARIKRPRRTSSLRLRVALVTPRDRSRRSDAWLRSGAWR